MSPLTGFDCSGCRQELNVCLDKASKFDSCCKLPYPILCSVADQSLREHSQISVTGTLYCMRQAWIKYKYPYYINPADMLQATYGTGLHKMIEDSGLNMWDKEVSVEVPVDEEFKVTGQIDAIRHCDDGTAHLIDYKFPGHPKTVGTTKEERFEALGSYFSQVRCYARMYELNKGEHVSRATIIIMPTCKADISKIAYEEVDISAKLVDMAFELLIGRARILAKAYKESIPPPIPYGTRICHPLFCPPDVQKICTEFREKED